MQALTNVQQPWTIDGVVINALPVSGGHPAGMFNAIRIDGSPVIPIGAFSKVAVSDYYHFIVVDKPITVKQPIDVDFPIGVYMLLGALIGVLLVKRR